MKKKTVSIKPDLNFTKPVEFKIGKQKIGGNNPCFIVAEIGINFDGDREKALKMIDAAVDAGCNAVKFQVFRSERMYAKDAGSLIVATGDSVDIHDLIKQMELPYDWLKQLKAYAESKKVEFFTSVCDEVSADVLEETAVEAYKIASYEITHLPLIEHVAKKEKPLIMSCGGATIAEVEEAIATAKSVGLIKIVLMHCIAKYDAPLNSLNLNVIRTLKLQYPEIIIGYSDHSSDAVIAPSAAVALGAKMIEKHITLDRKTPGPDHSFALEPHELKAMVRSIRNTEKKLAAGRSISVEPSVLGTTKCDTFENEEYVRKFAYRLLYATKKIKVGDVISKDNIAVLRSGESYKKYYETGLHPRYYKLFTGKKKYKATHPVNVGQAITWNDILS